MSVKLRDIQTVDGRLKKSKKRNEATVCRGVNRKMDEGYLRLQRFSKKVLEN